MNPASFPIFINRRRYVVSDRTMTGAEILALAELGEGYDLLLLQGEGDPTGGECILATTEVELRPGMHFRAVPGNCTFGANDEGISDALIADIEELRQAIGMPIDVVRDGNQVGIIIRDHPLTEIYSQSHSDIMMLTDVGYPYSAMDMFYMAEEVTLRGGAIPNHASSLEDHLGRRWRRWSWHRNGTWTPGADGVVSHYAFIQACLAREYDDAAARAS